LTGRPRPGRNPATVPALLATRAGQQPSRTAIVDSAGRELLFGEWHRRSSEVAAGLRERGVQHGDRIALVYGEQSWADFAIAYCAVQKAGAIAVPWSVRAPAPDTRYMMRDCGAVGVLAAETTARIPDSPWQETVATLSLPESEWEPELEAGPGLCRPGDAAQILYTSGTTGRPKGVLATHANLTFSCTTIQNRRPLRHSEHFVHAFPIGTNAGQTMLLNALDAHPTAVCLSRFVPGHLAGTIERFAAGTVFLVPAMAIELLRTRAHEQHDLSSVVLVGSTAAALPPTVARGLLAAFPAATVVNYYTSTEAAPAQTAMIFDPARPNSVGRAASGDLVVLDPDGRRLPNGTVGEVWMRQPSTPRSYYGDAAESAAVFRGSWVRMGDVGHLDDDGYLYLADRESDVIKSGAFKVSTLHVEAALHEHQDVVEAAVFGVPHPVLGMVVAAAVVTSRELTLAEVRGFLIDRVPAHELPTRVLSVAEMPRNNGGKVVKRQLREMIDT
jgi:acyl-CoA synthetase (AMP-forming)/AMP-acid ligase II